MEDASKGVFEQTGLDPDDIDFLVVNYMAGKTLPSLAALISGRLGLRTDCEHVNLGDMGCSAAVASVDVAVRMLLSEKKPGRALVLALEPVSNLFQKADDKGAIVGNTLFGEGCAAVVVSTHKEPMLYEIGARQRVVKADEEGVGAITLAWNDQGPMIQLSKSIPKVAGKAIEANLKRLVPRIISPLDKLKYLITRKVPRWQKRISRWAIHPGGTAVLRGFQKQRPQLQGVPRALQHELAVGALRTRQRGAQRTGARRERAHDEFRQRVQGELDAPEEGQEEALREGRALRGRRRRHVGHRP
jgi:predicted naringenin-chalcone synthase